MKSKFLYSEPKRRFIPQSRMRAIRWEEAVMNRRLKEEGEIPRLSHTTCSCGSVHCIGMPFQTRPIDTPS